ncbi:hypothetical protein [Maridesulfovibrio sp. FT414]|uniref:hypothetical protein n=1 Tax=Maridesulfovibrio sp. FT414 TaxID=2979469 RepID=UPI003D80974E
MKKLIAIALLIGAFLTAFHGFSMTAPMLGQKSMSRVNDMLGTLRIEMEVPVSPGGTVDRGMPYYVVAVLAGAGGILILSGMRDSEDEEDYY